MTAVAVLILALGVGANSVAFSLVNGFFLRPPPVREPTRLVRIYSSYVNGFQYFTVSYPDFEDMARLTDVLSGVLAEKPAPISLGVSGTHERLWSYLVSSGYFSVLGVKPVHGRFFAPDEDRIPGGSPVVVLGYGLWKRRFGGRQDVVGEAVVLNGQAFRIVGVAPEDFGGMNLGLRPELWVPAAMEALIFPSGSTLDQRGARGYFVAGRLRPGVTLGQARAALDLLARQLQQSYPDANQGLRFAVLPEAEGRLHPMLRRGFMGFSAVLVAVAALLLLLACANVAGLLLVRLSARGKEIGVRMALGATRRRIVCQFLLENASLSLLSGGAGVVLAWIVTRAVAALRIPIDAPISFEFGLDVRVLGFSLLLVVATALLVGLVPAFDASRSDLVGLLKDNQPASGRQRSRLRSALVAAQIALSTLLLIGGGLFLRSVGKAHRADVGFDTRGLVMASLDLGLQGYSPEEASGFWRRLDRLAALPHVESVSLASAVPLEPNITTVSVAPEGVPRSPDRGWPLVEFAIVGPQYFKTMRIPLLEGREYHERDAESSSDIVIVNDVLARQFWPETSAVGKRLTTPSGRIHEVVGVVKRTTYLAFGEEPKVFLYLPHRLSDTQAMTIISRGTGDPAVLLREVRETVRGLDGTIPLYNGKTMAQHLAAAVAPARWGAVVLNAVGLVALVLASVGLYGTLAYAVRRRTHEIGVRRALGAQDAHVLKLVVGQALVPVVIGLAAGIALGFVGSHLLSGLLYGTEGIDAVAFGLAPLVLLLASLLASWIPAQRALRIAPAKALRYE